MEHALSLGTAKNILNDINNLKRLVTRTGSQSFKDEADSTRRELIDRLLGDGYGLKAGENGLELI